MVSRISDNRIVHTKFHEIGNFLSPGDVLVINTSATVNGSFFISLADGTPVDLHLCTRVESDLWIVEVCEPGGHFTLAFPKVTAGERLVLPQGGTVTLHIPYLPEQRSSFTPIGSIRLWIATIEVPMELYHYLEAFATPIRYSYIKQNWSNNYYQTVYANEPGSTEMPSSGRAFTHELMTKLIARGIQVAPLVLHTGVASLRNDEPLYQEFYRVPLETAQLINSARTYGKRVIAVGTTVLRALETVTDLAGNVHPAEGWTHLMITPEYKIRAISGFLTGLHTARSTHMFMLIAFAGLPHVQTVYTAALAEKYLWHEFGDLHLIFR